MTLLTEKGTFAKTTSTSTPVSQEINLSGAFQPKALIVWGNHLTSNDTFESHYSTFFGFSDGTTDACQCMQSENNVLTSDADGIIRNDAIISVLSQAGTEISRASVASFDTDGFTLSWDVQSDTTAMVIHYIAIGGTDITNVKVVNDTVQTLSTGNFTYTGAGFTPNFVLAMNGKEGAAVNTVVQDPVFGFGAAVSATQQFCTTFRSEDGAGAMDADMILDTASIFWGMSPTTGAIRSQSVFVAFTSDGCTINHTNTPVNTGDRLAFLYIAGGIWDVGTFQQRSGTGTQTITLGTTDAVPKAVFLTGINSDIPDSSVVNNYVGIGASDGTSEGSIWHGDQNAADPMIVSSINSTTKVYRQATPNTIAALSTIVSECDMTNMATADQFTLDWTTADTTLRYLGYFTVGTSSTTTPVAQTNIHKYNIIQNVVNTGTHKYDIIQNILQTGIHKYNILNDITQSSIHKYDIIINTLQESIHKYNIISYVDSPTIHKYNILNDITQSNINKYHILNLVSDDSVHKYNISAYTIQSNIHKYNIFENILSDSIHKYNILQNILSNTIHKYIILENIIQNSVHKYHLFANVLTSSIHKYDMFEYILGTSISKYDILNSILQSSIHKYDILNAVIQETIHKYNILENIIANTIHKYNILEYTTAASVHKYHLFENILQSSIHKYHLFENIISTNIHKYNLIQNIVSESIHKYNIFANVIAESIHKYDIIVEGIVTASNIMKYHIMQNILGSNIHKYDILNTVGAENIHKYNIFQNALQTTIHKYNIIQNILTNNIHKYDIRQIVQNQNIHKYDIRNIVSQTSIHVYDIITALFVISQNIHKYDISQYIISSSIHKYHISTLAKVVVSIFGAGKDIVNKTMSKIVQEKIEEDLS